MPTKAYIVELYIGTYKNISLYILENVDIVWKKTDQAYWIVWSVSGMYVLGLIEISKIV